MSRTVVAPTAPRRTRPTGWAVATLLAGLVAGLSCRDSFPTAPTTVAHVIVAPRGPSLIIGDTLRLRATAVDENYTGIDGKTTRWSSAPGDVASIDANGLIRALKAGTSVVTADIDGHTDTTLVTVLPPPVDSIDVSPAQDTIILGLSRQFSAVTFDRSRNVLTGREVTWQTDDANVATVSMTTGLVTAAGIGTTWIRATSEGKSDSARVTVIPVPVRQVVVSPKPVQVQQGSTVQLGAQTLDSVGTPLSGRTVTWMSRNTAIASVSATGLVTGNAAGQTVVVATSEGVSDSTTVTVAVPAIALSSTSAAFTAKSGQGNPAAQTVQVTNGGSFTLSGLSASVSYGAGASGWLNASLSSTTAPSTLTLQPITGSLAPGSYSATVTVSSSQPGVQSRTVTVTFTVQTFPIIALSPDSRQFAAQANGAQPALQTVSITNAGTGTLSGLAIATSYGPGASGWLNTALTSTTAPSTLNLQPNTTALAVGTYTARVIVTSTADPSVAPDTVTVSYVVAQGPVIGLSRTTVAASAQAFATVPDSETVSISNAGGGTLSGLSANVTYTSAQTGWLTASLSSTTAPSTLTLVASAASLPAGSYGATVTISSTVPGVQSQTVTVTFTVTQQPVITLTPDSRAFTATRGGTLPSSQTVSVTNSGGGTLSGLSASTVYVSGSGWLNASLNTTTAPATLTLQPNTTSLTAGTYTARVIVSSTVPGVAPDTATVTYTVQQPQVVLSQTSVALGSVTRGAAIASSAITVSNGGQGTLSGLSATSNASWITPSLGSTTAPTTLTLSYNTTNLTAGSYTGKVAVTSSQPGVTADDTVTVTVTVLQPQIGLGSTSISRSSRPSSTGASVSSNTVSVSNSGDAGSTLSGLGVSDNATWLTASLNTTTAPATVTLAYNISGLAVGTYTATVTVSSSQPGVTSRTITVTLNIDWSWSSDISVMFGSAAPNGVSCQGCHYNQDNSSANFTVHSQMVGAIANSGSPCAGRTRIVASNASGSLVYQKLAGTMNCGSRMPDGGPYWGAADLQKLAEWINRGAPNN